jgi:hypothetical protein
VHPRVEQGFWIASVAPRLKSPLPFEDDAREGILNKKGHGTC